MGRCQRRKLVLSSNPLMAQQMKQPNYPSLSVFTTLESCSQQPASGFLSPGPHTESLVISSPQQIGSLACVPSAYAPVPVSHMTVTWSLTWSFYDSHMTSCDLSQVDNTCIFASAECSLLSIDSSSLTRACNDCTDLRITRREERGGRQNIDNGGLDYITPNLL